MKTSNPSISYGEDSISDRWQTEIQYHSRLIPRFALLTLPFFIFFTLFHFYRGIYIQALIHLMLSVNAVVSLVLMRRVEALKHLFLLRQITSAIAFGLLACSLMVELLIGDVYIAFPYLFVYPVAVILFYGQRIGLYCAIIFCVATTVIVLMLDLPPWNPSYLKLFKLNSAFALIAMLAIALISESTRVRMRDKLLEARNMYKTAEAHQRQTNLELNDEIELRIRSEKALAQSEMRYRALFEESAVSLWEEDWSEVKRHLDALPQEAAEDLSAHLKLHPDDLRPLIERMRVTAVNRSTLNLYEADTPLTLMNNIRRILPPDALGYMAKRLASLYLTNRYEAEVTAQTINGRKLHLLIGSTVPAGYETSWQKIFTSVYDVTGKVAMEAAKKQVERQLQHSRQFQAIASLAGGIAHQFNNSLAAIWGNLDLLELNLQANGKYKRLLDSLRISSDRMARLTEQLLAYAQGGKYQPKALSVNDLVQELLSTNKALHASRVRIVTRLEPGVSRTIGDTTQIKAVLEEVLSNAVESMHETGEVLVTTGNQRVEPGAPGPDPSLPTGNYVVTIIEDSGMGMEEPTRLRIFEPFFTTKFLGRGLGMAAAFGIVKNHNGVITVVSEPGKGTRVTIYLPVAEGHDGQHGQG